MLQNPNLKLCAMIVSSLLIDIAFAQAQVTNSRESKIITIVGDDASEPITLSVIEYSEEEFEKMAKAGLIRPATDEEIRQVALKAKEKNIIQDDSIGTIAEDDVEWHDLDFMDAVDPDDLDVVEPEPEEEEVYMVVEAAPEYPGGYQALLDLLRKNVKYPAICRDNGIQGRVVVSFVVDKDGSVVEPEVVSSVHPALDAEALRVISLMPKWKPGSQRGETVRVKFSVPVTFSLGDGAINNMSGTYNMYRQRVENVPFTALVGKKSQEIASPIVMNDPEDASKKCISVTTEKSPRSIKDTQLMFYCEQPFNLGDTICLSLKAKGVSKQRIYSEVHSRPGTQLAEYNPFKKIKKIGTEWNEYSSTYVVSQRGIHTIVLDLATSGKGNVIFFSDINIEVHHKK